MAYAWHMEDRTTGPGRALGRDDRPRRIRSLIRDLTADGHSVSELELDGLRVTLQPRSTVASVSPIITDPDHAIELALSDDGIRETRPPMPATPIPVSPRGYRDRAREEFRRRIKDSEVNS